MSVDSARAEAAAARLAALLSSLIRRVRAAGDVDAPPADRALHAWLGTRRERWARVLGWAFADAVISLAPTEARAAAGAFEGWQVDRALGSAVRALGLDDAGVWRTIELVRALIEVEPGALAAIAAGDEPRVADLFEAPGARAAAGWNEFRGAAFVNREACNDLLATLAGRDAVVGHDESFEAAARLSDTIRAAGYRVGASSEEVAAGEADGVSKAPDRGEPPAPASAAGDDSE